jgi:hypothetical protein
MQHYKGAASTFEIERRDMGKGLVQVAVARPLVQTLSPAQAMPLEVVL